MKFTLVTKKMKTKIGTLKIMNKINLLILEIEMSEIQYSIR